MRISYQGASDQRYDQSLGNADPSCPEQPESSTEYQKQQTQSSDKPELLFINKTNLPGEPELDLVSRRTIRSQAKRWSARNTAIPSNTTGTHFAHVIWPKSPKRRKKFLGGEN